MNENIRRQTRRHLLAQPDNLLVLYDNFLETPIQAIILLWCERTERLVRLYGTEQKRMHESSIKSVLCLSHAYLFLSQSVCQYVIQ